MVDKGRKHAGINFLPFKLVDLKRQSQSLDYDLAIRNLIQGFSIQVRNHYRSVNKSRSQLNESFDANTTNMFWDKYSNSSMPFHVWLEYVSA